MISPRALGRQIRATPLPRRSTLALPRWQSRLEPLHLAWLAIWAPWWVGNELPPPSHPRSREVEMTEQPEGTAGAWLLDTMDDLKLRFGLSWAAALLIRGASLGAIVGIGWILVAMVTGAPSPALRDLAVLVGVGAALGLVLRILHRPRYLAIALLLERAFHLRSRLSTAILALRFGGDAPGQLHALQLADAANTLDRARGELRPVHWVPVREIFVAFIVALTLLLLLVARRPEGEIPPASASNLPSFVPVSERLAAQQQAPPAEVPDAATLEEVEDLSRTSNQARQDLDAVRDALDDTSQTQSAAEAIASEDYPTANERLDESAGAVTQLPKRERDALADRLDEAASQVSEDNAGLADAASRAGDDVRAGEDTGAIDELGDQIEQTGEDVIPQEAEGDELPASSGESQPSGSAGTGQGGAAEQPEQPREEGNTGGEPGEAGDPGAGVAASGGTGESGESGQSGQTSGDGSQESEGASDAGGSGDVRNGDPTDQDGSGGQGSGETEQEPAGQEGSQGGNATGDQGGDQQQSADQGGGASGGDRESGDAETTADGAGSPPEDGDQASESQEGQAGDDPPAGGEGDEQGEGDDAASGGSAITLPGTSGERVSSGSDIGASSVGSGGGVGAASGDSTSGVSGSSGPDPNTVPAQWRDLVERYFREGGAP